LLLLLLLILAEADVESLVGLGLLSGPGGSGRLITVGLPVVHDEVVLVRFGNRLARVEDQLDRLGLSGLDV
ncbi:hypothetical protein PENTCL1PPCAC_12308, partial [Pristionchus entomophagus]